MGFRLAAHLPTAERVVPAAQESRDLVRLSRAGSWRDASARHFIAGF
jgi:hypothetical protein